jgi:hypothetical protein
VNRFFLPSIAFCGLVLGGCKDISGPKKSQAERVTITFGPSVTPAVQAHLRTLQTISDSAAFSPGGTQYLPAPSDSLAPLVVATNGGGDVLLAGTIANGAVTLDARSTALMAARMLPTALDPQLAARSDLDARVQAHPSFAALVQQIATQAEQGASYLDSDDAMEMVARIAADILEQSAGGAAAAAMQGAAALSIPAFRRVPGVQIDDLPNSPNYGLVNTLDWPFAAWSVDPRTGGAIGNVIVQRSGWLSGQTSTQTLTGANGRVRIILGQNGETKQEIAVQTISDFVEAFFKAIGLTVRQDNKTQFAVGLLADLMSPSLSIAIAQGSVGDVATQLSSSLWGHRRVVAVRAYAFARQEAGRTLTRGAAMFIVKNTLGSAFKAGDLALTFGPKIAFYKNMAMYGEVRDTAHVCQASGMFQPCVFVAHAAGSIVAETDTLRFQHSVPRAFRIVQDNGAAPPDIDYSQVSFTGNTNSQVSVALIRNATNFELRLTTNSQTLQTTRFDVTYRGQRLQWMHASVLDVDSTAIYEAAVLGTWTVSLVEGTSGPYRWQLSMESGSSGWRRAVYLVPQVPVGNGTFYCPNGPAPVDGWCHYGSSWRISRANGRYYLMDSGFWHPAFGGEARDPLEIPVTGFTTYSSLLGGAPSRRFVKN